MPIQITGPIQTREVQEKPMEDRTRSRRPANNRDNGSLNDLLGFTLPPRAHPAPRTSRRSAGRNHQWQNTRERYTNAQYRFMLKPTGDYTVHFADPDIYFNWPDVLQVIVPTSTVLTAAAHTFEGPSTSTTDSLLPSCPICLSEPVAPRMTKCGHIFCFPCLLHYLELGEGTGQKARSCPICFDTIYARELKSVKWFDPVSAASQSEASTSHALVADGSEVTSEDLDNADSKRGDYITMRLIHRSTISTLALPRSPTWPSELMPPHAAPWHFAPDVETFSRFMLATPDYMAAELRRDIQQLEGEIRNLRQLGPHTDDLGLVFVEAAQRKVSEQIEKVSMLRTDQVEHASETAYFDLESLRDKEGAELRRKEREKERALASATSASETDEYIPPDSVLRGNDGSSYRPTPKKPQATRTTPGHPSPLPSARNNRPRRNLNPPPPNDATYLFYQASSGQHIYLHPLDIKILKSHFESYSAFPLAIRVKVDGTEEGSMNEDLRKKCRYLAHLPSACDITFVEADLSKVISPEALAPYSQALKKRSGKRKDKAKKDDRARMKAEQAAQEKEREALGSRSRQRDTAYIPYLMGDMATLQVTDEDFPLSTSPSNTTTTAAKSPGEEHLPAGQRTVWGTRAVPAPPTGVPNQQDYEDEYQAVEHAWQDFDMMQQRGGRRQGRKKKVVLNLSGGAVSMRR